MSPLHTALTSGIPLLGHSQNSSNNRAAKCHVSKLPVISAQWSNVIVSPRRVSLINGWVPRMASSDKPQQLSPETYILKPLISKSFKGPASCNNMQPVHYHVVQCPRCDCQCACILCYHRSRVKALCTSLI